MIDAAPLPCPAVSVIMPAYNVEAFVDRAVASVLRQQMADLELLVVDDGSSDRTVQHLRRWQHDPRVRVFQQPNQGQSAARNLALAHSRAPILSFLDADDEWAPDFLTRHLAQLAAEPTVTLTFSRSMLIDHQSRPLGVVQHPMTLQHVSPDNILTRCPIWNPSAVCIRRTLLEQVQLQPDATLGHTFDASRHYGEDTQLWYRLALCPAGRWKGIDAILTGYRLNLQTSLTAQQQREGSLVEYFRTLWQEVEAMDPARYRRLHARAWAYHYRTQAQKATLYRRTGGLPLTLALRALSTDVAILKEEPIPTTLNLAAALTLSLLPSSWSNELLSLGARVLRGIRSEPLPWPPPSS